MTDIAEYLKPGSHLLKEDDETPRDWHRLIELAAILKKQKKSGTEVHYLRGCNIVLVFAKTSTRTRCAFEVAAADQGASTTYLDPQGSQMGHKESISDTAHVLGRFFDAIEFRGDDQSQVNILAADSGVPVWNGLTAQWHPTQMLADSLTMVEHAGGKSFSEITYSYVGDARYNMGRSLLINGALLGCDVRIVAPRELWPDPEVIERGNEIAVATGATITVTDDINMVAGSDFVHTDIWVSMGEPKDVWAERIELLRPYRVDEALMELAGPNAKFMHCLPAFHDLNTTVGRQVFEEFGLEGIEVTDEVFSGPRSVVFDQAENRLHTIKAVMVRSLGSM
ncbi:ornithine carbamoyltransferase [Schaalia sp. JY-X159]|jgi:ornithine carbamoyltransferase|uniref:ornithine carbamoyltransferase n=1 Tax=Schaalia sp. JY-X159 TaxID=2758575 RepID=UPI00165DB64F|nr:ornithine carbamoyltransferase [Schaalia sp. JY-X159]